MQRYAGRGAVQFSAIAAHQFGMANLSRPVGECQQKPGGDAAFCSHCAIVPVALAPQESQCLDMPAIDQMQHVPCSSGFSPDRHPVDPGRLATVANATGRQPRPTSALLQIRGKRCGRLRTSSSVAVGPGTTTISHQRRYRSRRIVAKIAVGKALNPMGSRCGTDARPLLYRETKS